MKKRMMSIIVVVFTLALLGAIVSTAAQAQTPTKELLFKWSQDANDIADPYFRGWKVYITETSGTDYQPFATVLYVGPSQDVYTSTETLTMPDAQEHTYYFVITAYNEFPGEIIEETGYSEEQSVLIALTPYPPGSIPFQFTVEIVIEETP